MGVIQLLKAHKVQNPAQLAERWSSLMTNWPLLLQPNYTALMKAGRLALHDADQTKKHLEKSKAAISLPTSVS